jgi:dolichol-phosphate mannosyltransferase
LSPTFELQILLPIHNEAESIEATVLELYREISPRVSLQFIFCEDGSTDNTKDVLRSLAGRVPAKLILSDQRKGYSRAVRDGMNACDAPWLLCLDSDGQCSPQDFWSFWDSRTKADIILGWRRKRADTFLRRTMSRTFYRFWKVLYHVPVNDPSCPYMLTRRGVIQKLVGTLGAMQQGFWWEFVARAWRTGSSIHELPVVHRERAAGQTQVYKLEKLPGIGYRHFIALFRIWAETFPSHSPAPARILRKIAD